MEDKKEVRNIKVFGHGRLYNPDTGEYFCRFNEAGEALVSKEEAQVIKKYHKQVLFLGQKEKPVKQPNIKDITRPKSMSDIKVGFKIPTK
ncbi:hypothetical protein KAX02_05600 [candidate division WOR-3 bacterium]|nr:hypothetical protein [candidate division WOR-3 bacterium]